VGYFWGHFFWYRRVLSAVFYAQEAVLKLDKDSRQAEKVRVTEQGTRFLDRLSLPFKSSLAPLPLQQILEGLERGRQAIVTIGGPT
jgi:hypothetical protein